MEYRISYFYPTSPYAERFRLKDGGCCVEWGKGKWGKRAKGFASYDQALAFAKTIRNGSPIFFSLDHPSRSPKEEKCTL